MSLYHFLLAGQKGHAYIHLGGHFKEMYWKWPVAGCYSETCLCNGLLLPRTLSLHLLNLVLILVSFSGIFVFTSFKNHRNWDQPAVLWAPVSSDKPLQPEVEGGSDLLGCPAPGCCLAICRPHRLEQCLWVLLFTGGTSKVCAIIHDFSSAHGNSQWLMYVHSSPPTV